MSQPQHDKNPCPGIWADPVIACCSCSQHVVPLMCLMQQLVCGTSTQCSWHLCLPHTPHSSEALARLMLCSRLLCCASQEQQGHRGCGAWGGCDAAHS